MPSAINADNGVVSGTAGLKSSADSSGVLDLQTNGTTAISISSSQVVSFANQPTYTGGTANGVMFLNGSKAVTTGTALTFDGSQLDIPLGSAGAPSLSTPTDPNTGMFFPAADTIAFAEGGVEAMRLDASGRLLVGTTSSIGTATVGRLQVLGGETFITTNSEAGGFVGVNSNADNSLALVADVDNLRAGSHIAFYVDGFSEKARIDASGNLLLGTTASQQTFTLQGGQRFINTAADGVPNATIGRISSQTRNFGSNIATNSFASIEFCTRNDAAWYQGEIRFFTNGSDGTASYGLERARITQSGVLDLATGAGAVGQIQFPATQVASANVNTLDDYEEGTWTTTFNTPSNLTGTPSLGQAIYTKIGRLVTVVANITGYSITSANTATYPVVNLPFPMSASSASVTGSVFGIVGSVYLSGVAVDNTGGEASSVALIFPAASVTTTGSVSIVFTIVYQTTT